jgi:adenosylcobinamide-phosphate synthase
VRARPVALDAAGLARATVESVAENTSDAVVGPLVWGAIGGRPGLLAYRAVNTLDAMVGHHSPRYERFGWAAARADDVANLLPSRVSAYLASGFAPVVGGRVPLGGARSGSATATSTRAPTPAGRGGVRRRAVPHPRRRLSYAGASRTGRCSVTGPAPGVHDIARAARLSGAVTAGAPARGGTRLVLDRARR